MLATILISLLLFTYIIILLYYRYGWSIGKHSFEMNAYVPSTRFSIIIAARNEEKNIGRLMNSLQQLNYPKHLYEIIVIDDHSEDKTVQVVKGYENVQLFNLSDYINGHNAHKKQAIALGISKSSGDYIVTTDADCIVSSEWLNCFDQIIQHKPTAFIAAPVMIQNEKNILQIFESLDFMMLQGITAAAVQTGIHTMSNGANLCYRKSAFEKVGGFADVDAIASGDDMLLMQKIQQEYPNEIHYCRLQNAIVKTGGAEHISAFIRQRIRWASKGKYYKEPVLKMILIAVFLLNLSLMVCMITSLFSHSVLCFTAALLGIKVLTEMYFLYPVSKFFNKQYLLWYFIPLQPLHIIYMVIAALTGNLTKYEWKGRVVR